MRHKVMIEAEDFLKALKDASLYAAKDNDSMATAYVMLLLNQKQKTIAVIACDGHGYYERLVNIGLEKGIKPSLPGKPMRLFIPRNSIAAILKNSGSRGLVKLTMDDAEKREDAWSVTLTFPDASTIVFNSPASLALPDYEGIRKRAEKGKKSNVNLGQVMMPVKELTRAGKVFPVKTGSTVPMYISQWKKGGCLTLLEYQEENVEIRVIFALSIPEAA